MLSNEDKSLVLKYLNASLDNLSQQRARGLSEYHFCHPEQVKYARMKEVEMDECIKAMKAIEEL